MTFAEERAADAAAYASWLAALKPGDTVAVDLNDRYHPPSIHRIVRLTATQFVLDTRLGDRYRRNDGGKVGGGSFDLMQPVTKAVRDRIEHAELRHWLYTLTANHKTPPLDALRGLKRGWSEATAAPKWQGDKYDERQRAWCVRYEGQTTFEPLMDDYEAGLETFVEAAAKSVSWFEGWFTDAFRGATSEPIPGSEFDPAVMDAQA